MTIQQQSSIEQEISLLFEAARNKLEKIDAQARKEKKQIVKDLAKDLEGQIPTDTISIEIVTQLHGKVSERFIRECLDEKYKQQRRVENAKKQKMRQEGDENLAALPPLNHEEQQAKNKEVIIQDVDERSVEEEEENPKLSPTIDNAFTDSCRVGDTKADFQSPESKDQSNLDLKECSNCKELYVENRELKEALEKSIQLITADNVSSSTLSDTNSADILENDEHTTYQIPKEKQDLIIAAIRKSHHFCSVIFDKNGILVQAKPDVPMEMDND
jgi:hypothetical protein